LKFEALIKKQYNINIKKKEKKNGGGQMTWQAQSMHCFRILPFCLNFVERGDS
jgi:hypothetical protein